MRMGHRTHRMIAHHMTTHHVSAHIVGHAMHALHRHGASTLHGHVHTHMHRHKHERDSI